jgi:hypothetical protein
MHVNEYFFSREEWPSKAAKPAIVAAEILRGYVKLRPLVARILLVGDRSDDLLPWNGGDRYRGGEFLWSAVLRATGANESTAG